MVEYHTGLRTLIAEKLNSNEIIFDVALNNSDEIHYYRDIDDENGYGVTRKRFVPTAIPSIIGDYINIPNISVTDNTIALEFDLFLGNHEDLELEQQEEYKSVDYVKTVNAIENMRKELLAQYHPLGDKQLRFGGDESTSSVDFGAPFDAKYIYIRLIPKNILEENIIGNGTKNDVIKKTNTNIVLDLGTDLLNVPYTVNSEIEIIFYNDNTTWYAKNLTNNVLYDLGTQNTTLYDLTTLEIGANTGFSGIVHTIAIDETKSDIYANTSDYQIHLYDFESKNEFTNKGTMNISTINEINNCILWGSLGNAIFSFETLVPIDDIQWKDDGKPYQLHGLSINALVSNDVLFGNNFEYYLTVKDNQDVDWEQQIFPIDRNHTYAASSDMKQKINERYSTSIIQSNSKEKTHTFFYNGDYHLTKLLKLATKNNQEQNTIFQLRVQFPFFSETYDVLVDSGGTSPNINNLSTFSITYKQKDINLT